MTGHLAGTGATGKVNIRNTRIRASCRDNGKILHDFADIESFDPDGLVNYKERGANDTCDYDSDGDGSRDRNWATAWQASRVENVDWFQCVAAHSQPLNANRKAYAAWWLWARVAGWAGPATDTTPPSIPVGARTTLLEPARGGLAADAAYDGVSGVAADRVLRGGVQVAQATRAPDIDTSVAAGPAPVEIDEGL